MTLSTSRRTRPASTTTMERSTTTMPPSRTTMARSTTTMSPSRTTMARIEDDDVAIEDDDVASEDDDVGIDDDAVTIEDDDGTIEDDDVAIEDDAVTIESDAVGIDDDAVHGGQAPSPVLSRGQVCAGPPHVCLGARTSGAGAASAPGLEGGRKGVRRPVRGGEPGRACGNTGKTYVELADGCSMSIRLAFYSATESRVARNFVAGQSVSTL
jgi:hypothetical protein